MLHPGLSVQVDFKGLDADTLPRAAQLTQRTSQMNACKDPMTPAALGVRCARDAGCEGICVTVRDRFGDHGVAGFMLVRRGGGRISPGVSGEGGAGGMPTPAPPGTLAVDEPVLKRSRRRTADGTSDGLFSAGAHARGR